jgi:hypothetical protein
MLTSFLRSTTVCALGALLAALGGCSNGTSPVQSFCPPIESTGGNPVGTWTVTYACQVPYAQQSTADWCAQLVYGDGTVKDGLFLGQAFIPVDTMGGSKVVFTEDPGCPNHDCGTYMANLIFAGPTTTKFPKGCLEQHTPNPTCQDLQADMLMLIMNDVLPMIQNLSCADDGAGGCDCSYTVTNATVAGDVGTWRVENNLMMIYPSLPNQQPPETADVSVDGNVMQLHGHASVPLLAHDPLRTLTLAKKQ